MKISKQTLEDVSHQPSFSESELCGPEINLVNFDFFT